MLITNPTSPFKLRIQLWDTWVKMSTRSRSASCSRVVVKSTEFVSGEALDAVAFLDRLLNDLKTFDIPLSVELTDGNDKVAYPLSAFVSKQYEVSGDDVYFGIKTLNLRTLKAEIKFDVHIVDDRKEH